MARSTLTLPFSGRRLRAERERAGLHQEQLAARCAAIDYPVDRSTISSLEIGRGSPSAPLLAALAKALDVEVDVLLDPEPPHETNASDAGAAA